MPKFFLQKSQWLYAILTFCLTFLFLDLALHCYYSDSEIWLLTSSQNAFSPNIHFAIYYKWFFHILTFLSTAWTTDNVLTFQGARLFYALISLLAVGLNSLVFCKVFQNKKLFFPLFIINLTSSLFFNQGFRIRADIVALLIHVFFLWIVIVSNSKKLQNAVVFVALHCLLLLTTPKSILFLALHFILGLLFFFRGMSKEQKRLGRNILLSLFFPMSVLLFILCTIAFFNQQHPVLLAIHSAINFYLKSFDPALGGAAFFKPLDFLYLIRFFKWSPVHSLLFLFWLVSFFISLFRKENKQTLKSYFSFYSVFLFIFVLCYNQKLPFFLAAFLVPLIAFQFGLFTDFVSQRPRLSFLPPVLLVVTVFFAYKQYLLNSLYNYNEKQLYFVSQLQNYKQKNSTVTIYDVIGLLPKNNTYSIFIGPGDVSQRSQIFSLIETQRPDIYLYTFKNVFFEPEVKIFLEGNYFQYSPGVWVLAKKINFKETSFTTDVVRIKNKNYWLIPIQTAARVFEVTSQKEISSSCFYIDQQKQVSQKPTNRLAIPFDFLKVTVTEIALPQLDHNPYDLFRFDTAF